MTPEKEDFVSEWLREPRDANQFAQNFEKSRKVHSRPLTHAYHKLVSDEGLSDTNLLCLGIGTGIVEEMMQLDSLRITAIDFNPSYIERAKTRLPNAHFLEGKIEDLIDKVDFAPTVLTQEALDCIPPRQLPELMAKIRDKTDKLVAVYSYSPDPEFYGSSWEDANLALGGTGVEGMTQAQQALLERRLSSLGVQSTLDDQEKMLTQLQSYVEKVIGAKFSINIVAALVHIGYPFGKKLPPQTGLLSLPAQASLLLNHVELETEKGKKYFQNRFPNRPIEAGKFISLDTTHRFLQILLGTYRIDTFMQILTDACSQAGFNTVTTKSISATEKRVATERELVAQVNRSLDVIKKTPVARRIRADDKSSRAFVGSPIILMEPTNNPYSIARVPYLVAS